MSNKMWAGRFEKELDALANDFNSSIKTDSRMYEQDIKGSIAHAMMLGASFIITQKESDEIIDGLTSILNDINSGELKFDETAEDIHMFIEAELTKRIGDVGKKLHTARSRNDQVALDLRLYLREETDEIIVLLKDLIKALLNKAKEHTQTIMPGYTHLQRAQPITFGHHLLAYAAMFLRDIERLSDVKKRINVSPIGSCALAGTTYNINRDYEASLLKMEGIAFNSLDGVSDRDFAVELANAIALIMVHLSRFSEEIILFSSFEFKFIELSDEYSTGSSIMPQKKNPDMAELVRGKSGRVFGNLITLLTMLKGLPLAYNKDMQEDKEAIFDSCDTVKLCLSVFTPMLETAKVLKENMRNAAAGGFINATDCADFLVTKGLAFRDAYKITGQIVAFCINNNKTLETMTLADYQAFSSVFDNGIYEAINLENCVALRNSKGGTSPKSVLEQISLIEKILKSN